MRAHNLIKNYVNERWPAMALFGLLKFYIRSTGGE